jgi:hypothetical protein
MMRGRWALPVPGQAITLARSGEIILKKISLFCGWGVFVHWQRSKPAQKNVAWKFISKCGGNPKNPGLARGGFPMRPDRARQNADKPPKNKALAFSAK